jgi:putative ABC transport system substrate-binding protein
MRRRKFIAGLGGTFAGLPLSARTQQPAASVIGFLNGASPTVFAYRVAAFREVLAQMGYVEDQNVKIEYQWGEGQTRSIARTGDRSPGHRVAVIAATGGVPSVRAAKTATSEIPIVFTFEGDPVAFGLVASLNRPGGNVTGITMISSLIVSKRIGFLRDLIPGIKTIAILMNSTSPANKAEVATAERAARTSYRR